MDTRIRGLAVIVCAAEAFVPWNQDSDMAMSARGVAYGSCCSEVCR